MGVIINDFRFSDREIEFYATADAQQDYILVNMVSGGLRLDPNNEKNLIRLKISGSEKLGSGIEYVKNMLETCYFSFLRVYQERKAYLDKEQLDVLELLKKKYALVQTKEYYSEVFSTFKKPAVV